MKIKVLYEDKDILAIDKPSGVLVHPDQKVKKNDLGFIHKKISKGRNCSSPGS